ncbi:2OG-Fe(II) oxygenase [Steroidobacter sp.]|uniref:2OG-Fe(II) oxygenase n=1 Tax=Steroidobacter sp. TaxID=1978227 RepID=UPI001A5A0663|nr:2OG-Fe(II) oxygenase family protein [Steroidobacter sp.]MBL8271356.1 2OG-Fe(II) oxygenase [Steroidobacter sp.]
MTTQIQLNPKLDRRLIREVFKSQGRVHIPDVLTPSSATALFSHLETRTPWQLCFNVGQRHVDVAHHQLMLMPPEQREAMSRAMLDQSRRGFQYVFENYPLFDLYQAGERDTPLLAMHEFLNSEEFLQFARQVTGFEPIAFADSQATKYLPGHFLTEHDDNVAGKQRLAAYVFGFTPDWRADWGGILQFIDRDGHIAEGYAPKFNVLNLFRVPQTHNVSYVAPAAGQPRYSITGWLRAAG